MLRRLRRDRWFYTVVVALLGLGMGSATAVFGLVNELLLKPLPVRDPKNLYLLEHVQTKQVRPDPSSSERSLNEVVRASPLVSAAVAETPIEPQYIVPMKQGGATRLLMAQIVSSNYFRELGVKAALGRLLDESDERPAAVLPAVISYQFWQAQFAGEASAIGRTIRLKDTPFAIVGVMPRDFHSSDMDRAPEVRLPRPAVESLFSHVPEGVKFAILLRLAPGVTPDRAAAALHPKLQQVEEEVALERNARASRPEPSQRIIEWARQWTTHLQSMERGASRVREQFGGALRVLLGAVGILLLAVCANVSGLLIGKSGDRRREIGIRMAIGAGRARIIRELAVESLVLSAAGALLGAGIAWTLAPQIVRLLPPVRDLSQYATPQLLVVTPDLRVLGFVAGLALFATAASGLVPAWRASRVDLTSELKAVRGQGQSARPGVVAIAVQVALGAVLLSAAGLLFRTYRNLDRMDGGFERARLIEFTIDPASAGYNMAQSGHVFAELRRRVAALPGVRSTAWAWRAVMRGSGIKSTVAPQGVALPASTFLNVSLNEVTPGYFETMGLRLISGRDLRLSDDGRKPAATVINEAAAATLFPGQDPLGKFLVSGTDGTKPADRVVVGLVSNAKYRSLREPDAPTIYGVFNESNGTDWQTTLYVRAWGAPSSLSGAVRQALRETDGGVPLVEAVTLEAEMRASLWQERLVAVLAVFFGAASAMLAAIGLYGALSLMVAQRRRELGIRIAVGARTHHVTSAVCSPIAVAVGCGLVAGLGASAWLLRLARALLYGVEPLDGQSMAAAVLIVVLSAVMAALPPARRATRVDPASILREE